VKRATLDAVLRARADKRAVALVTRLDGGEPTLVGRGDAIEDPVVRDAVARALAIDDAFAVDAAGGRTFVQPFNPPLRLVVVGAVHIAGALAEMARLAGYDVTIVDPREAFTRVERFEGWNVVRAWPDEALPPMKLDHRTAVVTLTHDPKIDDPALEAALASDAFYVGSLGSGKTHAARLKRLAEKGIAQDALARIHGPVGLAIGARSPAEIAISILAQMTARLRGAA
jgi:xanthine dehydrogenase accessory factor